jgi:hypothetical protein
MRRASMLKGGEKVNVLTVARPSGGGAFFSFDLQISCAGLGRAAARL